MASMHKAIWHKSSKHNKEWGTDASLFFVDATQSHYGGQIDVQKSIGNAGRVNELNGTDNM